MIPPKYTFTGSKTFAPHDLYYIATWDTSHYMEDSRLLAVRLWLFRYFDDTKTVRWCCKCWLNSISHMWSDQFTWNTVQWMLVKTQRGRLKSIVINCENPLRFCNIKYLQPMSRFNQGDSSIYCQLIFSLSFSQHHSKYHTFWMTSQYRAFLAQSSDYITHPKSLMPTNAIFQFDLLYS